MKEENLIFLISQPRAGSTYLQNLLSNNPEINTCSESWILLNYANQIKPSLVQAKFDNDLAVDAFNDYVGKYSNNNFSKKQKEFVLGLYTPMADGFKFVIDKTPRYWEILEELVVLFPKSKIIILKRNPLDVAKSMIKTWGIKTFEKLAYFKRDLLLAPKQLKNFSDKHKKNRNVYSLRYEDLVADTAVEVKKLYDWCGIAYDDMVLDTSKNEKYKGKYGDPYQNSEVGYNHSKAESQAKELTTGFADFLKGYAYYLSEDFLLEYGDYKVEGLKPKKTQAFSQFVHFSNERGKNYVLKKELKYFIKQLFYNLFK